MLKLNYWAEIFSGAEKPDIFAPYPNPDGDSLTRTAFHNMRRQLANAELLDPSMRLCLPGGGAEVTDGSW